MRQTTFLSMNRAANTLVGLVRSNRFAIELVVACSFSFLFHVIDLRVSTLHYIPAVSEYHPQFDSVFLVDLDMYILTFWFKISCTKVCGCWTIEKLTLAAASHLQTAILGVHNLTGDCGSTTPNQSAYTSAMLVQYKCCSGCNANNPNLWSILLSFSLIHIRTELCWNNQNELGRASAIVSISHHHHNCLLYLTLFGHLPVMSVLIFKEKEWFAGQPWLDAVLKGDLFHYH